MDINDALLFLDLDKGVESAGPLFEEPRRRLQSDPRLRAGWSQYQALRALAIECAPEPGEKLIRQALAESRRERVKQQLSRAAGSEDLAREILLGRVRERRGLPAAAWLLALALGAGAAWLLLGPQIQALIDPSREARLLEAAGPLPTPPPADADNNALTFEFPAQTPPAQAALSAPQDDADGDDTEDVSREDAASRQARRLVRENLLAQVTPRKTATPAATQRPAPPAKAAPPALLPVATATARPQAGATAPATPAATAEPTAQATEAPTARPSATPLPTAVKAPIPVSDSAVEASFSLSAPSCKPGGRIVISVTLPQQRDLDLRLFDQRGRPIKGVSSGAQGPGTLHVPMTATDEQGQALTPGTYYLRVMTPWFSRVEPIEVTQ